MGGFRGTEGEEDVVLPTYEEASALPTGGEQFIPRDYIDRNGHMNVRHYLGVLDDCGFPYLERFGIDTTYPVRERRGIMDLENHVRYLAEVFEGDRISAHLRLVDCGPKSLHWMNFMVNHTNRMVAATLELITVHVDLETRRVVEWSPETAGRMAAQLEQDKALPWAAPTSGCMGIKR
jgi:acyl-CoA thioester hydrolase